MLVTVHTHPGSRAPRIETVAGELHIYVREPAREGKATEATRQALADYYDVAPSLVSLQRGPSSTKKLFFIDLP